jgi:hypothetical protein
VGGHAPFLDSQDVKLIVKQWPFTPVTMYNRKASPSSLPVLWLDQYEWVCKASLKNRAALLWCEWYIKCILAELHFCSYKFHGGVKSCVRPTSTLCVWAHLWDEMQINDNSMLRLQIWTQMKKCKRKFCISILISHGVIITISHDMVMSRTWDLAQLLLLALSFTFYSYRVQVFCIASLGVGNDSVIHSQ